MTNVFIQKDKEEFDYDFLFEAYLSFSDINFWSREKIYNIVIISHEKLLNSCATLESSDVFVGTVEFMKTVFEKFKIKQPKPINIPKEISIFAYREISEGFLKDLEFPCFIKPAEELKLFTGFVIKSTKDLNLLYPQIKEDTKLFISEVEDFVSEYRCFVYKGKIIDMRHYSGDFRDLPTFHDIRMVDDAIKHYKSSPMAYTADFGITKTGRAKLIEVNDFYSCGTYGFSGETYALMLKDRFREIIKNGK